MPLPMRLKGKIRVHPSYIGETATPLGPSGLHWWMPIAPRARVEVDFEQPDTNWSGNGYLDCNFGEQPLEAAFKQWNWSRGHTASGTTIFYNGTTRDGDRFGLARLYDESGSQRDLPSNDGADLPATTIWRVKRSTICDTAAKPRLVKTLEDTPFYARSIIETTSAGDRLSMVHESLSLDRFSSPVVRAMLPFRMPRWRYSP
ncbi:hydratase [Hyphomicrobium sp. ghe19]|uniref:hydratase n=1 Tax=Hyphomicrobium sp. ghe19 TaxID=2682968 RepID=UPI0030CC83CB